MKNIISNCVKCWLWKGLWLVAVVGIILVWVSFMTQKPVLGLAPELLLWTALIAAVLAISVKLDCTSDGCKSCAVPPPPKMM